MKKILITGKSGYIASTLTKRLSENHAITAIGREDFDLANQNDCRAFFSDKCYDVVIHCAVMGGNRLFKDSFECFKTNVEMFLNLKENKHKFDKLLHFGSGAEFSLTPYYYGYSKKIISSIIKETKNFYNLRIFGVFDENDLKTRFIVASIINSLKGNNINIHENKFMDFIYMKDLVSLVEYYINMVTLSKDIDCCYKDKVTLHNIANIINSLSDKKVKIDNNGFNYKSYIGSQNELPIKTIGLKEGIKNTYKIIKYGME